MNQLEIKNLTVTEDCFSKGDYLVSFVLKKMKISPENDCIKHNLDPYHLDHHPIGPIDPFSLVTKFTSNSQPAESKSISPLESFTSTYPTLSPLTKHPVNKLGDSLKNFQLNQLNEKLQKIAADLKDLAKS